MKAFYKTVDYVFDNLPKEGEIESEIESQDEKGWSLMDKTKLIPESPLKPMTMTITYKKRGL